MSAPHRTAPRLWHSHERLLLRVLQPDGLPPMPVRLIFGMSLASAAIADLRRAQRVGPGPEHIDILSTDPIDAPLPDALLSWMAADPRRGDVRRLGRRAGGALRLTKLAGARLVSAGVLGLEEKHLLWIFRKVSYPWLADRDAVLADLGEDDAVEALLQGLGLGGSPPRSDPAHLARRVFDEALARTKLSISPQT